MSFTDTDKDIGISLWLSEIPVSIEAWLVCGRAVFDEVTISNHLFCFILMQTAPQSSSQDCPTNRLEDRDEICATAGEASWEAGCLTLSNILS